MTLAKYLENLITTNNIHTQHIMGTLKPDATYTNPTMVKRKYKRNNAVKNKKSFIAMQTRQLVYNKV